MAYASRQEAVKVIKLVRRLVHFGATCIFAGAINACNFPSNYLESHRSTQQRLRCDDLLHTFSALKHKGAPGQRSKAVQGDDAE